MPKRGKHDPPDSNEEPLVLPAEVIADLRATFCSYLPGGEDEFEQLLAGAVEAKRVQVPAKAADPNGVGFTYHEVRYADCPQEVTGRKTKLSATTLVQIIHRCVVLFFFCCVGFYLHPDFVHAGISLA